MQAAGETAGDGGMVAVLGADAADQAGGLAEAHGLSLANDNSPQQVVLLGPRARLPAAEQAAREARPEGDDPAGRPAPSTRR